MSETSGNNKELHVVTGALGFTGKYIARRLLAEGHRVRTLTNSTEKPNPFGDQIEIHPFHFEKPEKLVESLRGAKTLYNTYWVRFNHKTFSHALAVENTLKLFDAAKNAGVNKVVHISITNADEKSDLEYFRGKGQLERALRSSGISYDILRPAVIFGDEDILINNIAWMLRRFPVFGLFGDGSYRIQPIYVEDLAGIAVREGKSQDRNVMNAIGPETFTFRELVKTIGRIIGKRRPVISIPPAAGYAMSWLVGKSVGDVLVTRHEIKGLMRDLLYAASSPIGKTRLTDWAEKHRDTLGREYHSELARRKSILKKSHNTL